jgi:hypothetical protein
MSALSYRSWDIWINTSFFNGQNTYDGYYECTILNTLMVQQSIEFLVEKYEIRNRHFCNITFQPSEIVNQVTTTEEGQLCIRVYESFDTSLSTEIAIQSINAFIDSISLAIDAPLTCLKIRFISQQHGKLLVANRRSIGRGFSFEVEERGIANQKIQQDILFYQDSKDDYVNVGRRHYMTGMQLLSMEDQITGLIDAAFMQFYQGCEALCRDEKGGMEESKKYIAKKNCSDSKELQIILHQVWRVRNKYFGHGDVSSNIYANLSKEHANAVAKQVLVARYLCRRLLDLDAPSNQSLIREMGLFFGEYSGNFTGQLIQLKTSFKVEFDKPDAKIYDDTGSFLESYDLNAA